MNGPQSETRVDVAIVGGGIAGSSLAIALQRAGLQTVLVEREAVFRDRIRGEACHPWGVREMDALGLRPIFESAGGVNLPTWSLYRDGQFDRSFQWTDLDAKAPAEIGFNHPAFQEALLQAAIEDGSLVYRPARANILQRRDHWNLTISDDDRAIATVRAAFIVAADGKNSSTRKLWGAEGQRDPVHHQFGGMLVRGVDLDSDSAHQGYHERGFAMIFPQGDNRARVYYTCPTEEARVLSGTGNADDFLAAVARCYPNGTFTHAEPAGPHGFFPNADLVCTRIAGPRAVAIGDAAGANDPTQGQGMSLTFRDARVLRDLLTIQRFEDVSELFEEERRAAYDVARVHASWAAPLLVGAGPEADALQEQVQRAREKDPSAGGYANIFVTGPVGLPTDVAARQHFYGENLPDAVVHPTTILDEAPIE